MDNTITAINSQQAAYPAGISIPRVIPQQLQVSGTEDLVEFGSGEPVTTDQAMGVVLERAYAKLAAVVSDARAELGVPEDAVIDTSPEATANRIADFALGFFDRWYENHSELGEDEARTQFAEFIGGAIDQGIDEARGILTALSALTPDVDTNIGATYDIIQERLNDFIVNG